MRSRLRKWCFIFLIGLIAAATLFAAVDAATSGRLVWFLTLSDERPSAPNVILVVVDALRADHLSQYSYARDTSSVLSRFADQAVRFDHAFSPSSWTVPSTASIFSGIHPLRHHTTRRGDSLNHKIDTLAEILRRAGYDTAGFSYNINISKKTRFNQGFDDFFSPRRRGHSDTNYPDISEMIDQVTDWVDFHGRKKPFFLYMQPMNCHGPYRVPLPKRKILLSTPPSRLFRYYGDLMTKIMIKGHPKVRREVTREFVASLTDQYDTAVRYTAEMLSVFFQYLKANRMWENAMVVVTADHGEELFDHGGFSHGFSLYDEVVRVPLFIKLPYQQRRATVDTHVSLLDIHPTVTAAMGVQSRSVVDGKSLLPFFKKVNEDDRIHIGPAPEQLLGRQLVLTLDWPKRAVINGLVNKRLKYLETKSDYVGRSDVREIFDRLSDVRERRNLIEKRRKDADKLEALLEKRISTFEKTALNHTRNVLDEMNLEALKALGYVH